MVKRTATLLKLFYRTTPTATSSIKNPRICAECHNAPRHRHPRQPLDRMTDLHRTPLYALHIEHGAKLTPFAGYEMPLNYSAGIIAEHLHVREHAGLFDASHMGVIELADDERNALALEKLTPTDVCGIADGRQRYALLTRQDGGVLDDLMVQRIGGRFVLVVNAACKQNDLAHLRAQLGDACEMKLVDDCALLALQGPRAAESLAQLNADADSMKFMEVREMQLCDAQCRVSRSGYTGEDGFEIIVQEAHAERVARDLLAQPAVQLCGLGARDSLRLEAGLCLYGNELTAQTTPIEAGLNWAIGKARRPGGNRAGGFLGEAKIFAQLQDGAPTVRAGFIAEGRTPVRAGAKVTLGADDSITADAERDIGIVTSGGYSPSLAKPIGMASIARDCAKIGARHFAQVRNKRVPIVIVQLPFVAARFNR